MSALRPFVSPSRFAGRRPRCMRIMCALLPHFKTLRYVWNAEREAEQVARLS